MLIDDNRDFIYELKILGATYTDEMKRKFPMTYTCAAAVAEKSLIINSKPDSIVSDFPERIEKSVLLFKFPTTLVTVFFF
jgi:hypothetical protein